MPSELASEGIESNKKARLCGLLFISFLLYYFYCPLACGL
jgi:hypothetical protein